VRVLLTGFEPFLDWAVNPSQSVVAAIADEAPTSIDLRTATLPVAFDQAGPRLTALLEELRPEIALMLGQGGGTALRIERVGINLNDIPVRRDIRGAAPEEEPIVPGGPAAYFATIPVRALTRHLNDRGIPSVESRSAGAFLCNHVLYAARHYCDQRELDCWVGFVHLPLLPEQAAADPASDKPASMALGRQVAGISEAIAFLVAARAEQVVGRR
jgi:pyroglutamyl-peptidase